MKRLLAILLVSLCLFSLFSCAAAEPLPEKPAPELMQLSTEKMRSYASYEMNFTLEANNSSSRGMSKITLRCAANGDLYMKMVSESSEEGASQKSTTEMTLIGEDAYLSISHPVYSQKLKTSATEASIMLGTIPKLEDIFGGFTDDDFATAEVTVGTNTWTVTLTEPLDFSGIGIDLTDMNVKSMVTKIVIGRDYNIRSVTTTFDVEEKTGSSDEELVAYTGKLAVSFSRLGTTRVSLPADADEYRSVDG